MFIRDKRSIWITRNRESRGEKPEVFFTQIIQKMSIKETVKFTKKP